MQSGLKSEILGIVRELNASGKHYLAKCIEKNWNKSALSYSKEINVWGPKEPMEKEIVHAFQSELSRLNTTQKETDKIIASLNKNRVLQTAPHLGVTSNPRMLCLEWLGSLGVPNTGYCISAPFSGIPFSNASRPGRINKKSESINLFPSTMQNALVYRSKIKMLSLEGVVKSTDLDETDIIASGKVYDTKLMVSN